MMVACIVAATSPAIAQDKASIVVSGIGMMTVPAQVSGCRGRVYRGRRSSGHHGHFEWTQGYGNRFGLVKRRGATPSCSCFDS